MNILNLIVILGVRRGELVLVPDNTGWGGLDMFASTLNFIFPLVPV